MNFRSQRRPCRTAQDLPPAVHLRNGTNRAGKMLHYYLHYSGSEQSFRYSYAPATELLSSAAVASPQQVSLRPWDLAILEEKQARAAGK